VFLRLAEPIDFSALDGQPVDLVFALAVPEHFSHQHLLLLSQLAEMFSDAAFCARLRTAPDNGALYALLADWQLAHAAA
jgi:PTS system nitrogen regulatory IIA component